VGWLEYWSKIFLGYDSLFYLSHDTFF
jgi:hypothetical protein